MIKVGIVVPHFFMNRDILPNVIFAPGNLSIGLAEGLRDLGLDITLFSPGCVDTKVKNINVDLSYFKDELKLRGDSYLDLLKKHPLVFISLARQAQAELISRAFDMANSGELDIVHIYTNEEDIALPFIKFCKKPVFLTHHDPFSYLVRYKHVFPKYKRLNWISLSFAQRQGMPKDTNWAANIYNGIDENLYEPSANPANDYIAYLGRIIKPKGLHLAIDAVKKYNATYDNKIKLKIAGKHYSEHSNDLYWEEHIKPKIDNTDIEYIGSINTVEDKQAFLSNARATIMPSLFEEPFGLVSIESLACGTPVIGLNSGAIPEIVNNKVGVLLNKVEKNHELDEQKTVDKLAKAIDKSGSVNRKTCRIEFEARFTLKRMCLEHADLYKRYYKK